MATSRPGLFGQQARNDRNNNAAVMANDGEGRDIQETASLPEKKKRSRKPKSRVENDDEGTTAPKKKPGRKPKAKPGEEGNAVASKPTSQRKKPGPKPKNTALAAATGAISPSALITQGHDLSTPTPTAAGSGSRKRGAPTQDHDSDQDIEATTHNHSHSREATPRKRARFALDDAYSYSAFPDVPSDVSRYLEESNTVETAPPYPYDEAHPDFPFPQIMSRRRAERRYRGGDDMPPLGDLPGEEDFLENPAFYDGETEDSSSASSSDCGAEGEDESSDCVADRYPFLNAAMEAVLEELNVSRSASAAYKDYFSLRELRDQAAFHAEMMEAFQRYGMGRWYKGMKLELREGQRMNDVTRSSWMGHESVAKALEQMDWRDDVEMVVVHRRDGKMQALLMGVNAGVSPFSDEIMRAPGDDSVAE